MSTIAVAFAPSLDRARSSIPFAKLADHARSQLPSRAMTVAIDHIILKVNDVAASAAFYEQILGFADEGERAPFRIVRVSDAFSLQLAPWGTEGGEHLAFALDRPAFDETFARIRAAGVPYGDSFHAVGNQKAPGKEIGSRGVGDVVYFFDPNKHLLEIRVYGGAA